MCLNPVEWPKTGLEVQDAINLVEEGVHEGHVPIFTDSIFCLRHMQHLGYPLHLIVVRNPIALIGLVESRALPKWLGNVSWVLVRKAELDCVFTANLYGTMSEGLEELRFFKNTLLEHMSKVRHVEVPVQIVDKASAVDAIPASVTEGTAVIATDSLDCMWKFRNDLRRVFLVEKPLLLVAITSLDVNRELEEMGQPAFMIVDDDTAGSCLWGGFLRPSTAIDYRAEFRRLLKGLLKVVATLDVPLEFVIMETGSLIDSIVNKGAKGG